MAENQQSLTSFKHAAFLSYAHADHDIAVRLHKALEEFRTPKDLIGRETGAGPLPRRLHRVFRDEAELGAAHELGGKIEKALDGSAALIVVCSPRSAQSKWVNREIEYYKRLGREDRVFAVIVDGETHAKDPSLECFPDALKWKLTAGGERSTDPAEPLAVDLRKFGEQDTALRLAAGVLDVDYDDLKRRDLIRERTARRRAAALFSGGLALMIAAVVAGVGVFLQSRAVAERTSQLFAARAAELNEQGYHAKAALMALRGLPAGDGIALGYDSDEARAQLERTFVNGRLKTVLRGHEKSVQTVAYSPDGKRILTLSEDDTARLWDAESGEQIAVAKLWGAKFRRAAFAPGGNYIIFNGTSEIAIADGATLKMRGVPRGHEETVADLAFSPDGSRLVTASFDGTARLWNPDTFSPRGVPMRHDDLVTSAAFSPDGSRILTASYDGTARLWDGTTGAPLGSPMAHEKEVSATFSPDGNSVVTTSGDTAWLWDGKTGQSQGSPMRHEKLIAQAIFSSNSELVATMSSDQTIRLWDARTGALLGPPISSKRRVTVFAFSPDKKIIIGTQEGELRFWWGFSGEPVGDLMRHEGDVTDAAFSPDGTHVLTTSWDGAVRLWNVQTSRRVGEIMRHDGAVLDVVFSPDGRRFVTASIDGTARIWDVEIIRPTARMVHDNTVWSAVFSPEGDRIVTASLDGTTRIWDGNSGAPIGAPLRSGGRAIFSPDGGRILTFSFGIAQLWDAKTGKALGALMRHKNYVYSAAFSPDGLRIVTASEDETAQLWDGGTGEPIGSPMLHEHAVDFAAFSPDGNRILTSSNGDAQYWNGKTGEPLGGRIFGYFSVRHAAFSFDGSRIVTASGDGSVQLWDVVTGAPLGAIMRHAGEVNSVEFSPNGARVVTASDDGSARLWDGKTGAPLGVPMFHNEGVTSAAFSPDGRHIITVSGDSAARLWDGKTGASLGIKLQQSRHISAAAFSPDGGRIVTAGGYIVKGTQYDGSVQLWRVPDFLLESPETQLDIACARLREWNLDYDAIQASADNSLLTLAPDRPCDRVGAKSPRWWAGEAEKLYAGAVSRVSSLSKTFAPPQVANPSDAIDAEVSHD